MTRKAVQTREISGWQEKVHQHRKRDREQAVFRDRTFSELSAEDKDALLKQVAERLGLIKTEG